MGRFKKQTERDLKGMSRAHKMAEAFAKYRTDDFVKALCEDTGLHDGLGQPLEAVQSMLNASFGKALAIAYACGFCDAIQGSTIKQLYVLGKPEVEAATEDDKQLVFPGVLD